MNRKNFLKTMIAGAAIAGTGVGVSKTVNKEKEDIVGFNHLPVKKENKMKKVVHRAETRGHANHGWLDSKHSFSFASYYNPERMGFGALRVLNDDHVEAGMGFGKHPHDNMEIISIPLKGDLEHKDSMGTSAVIKEGDVQVMSAGTGIFHSEYNKNDDQEVKFLQIWVITNKRNVEPRYDQIILDQDKMKNNLYQILSPNPDDDGVWVHQNAWFHLTDLESGKKLNYELKDSNNGVYAFVIEGNVNIAEEDLNRRDAIGIIEGSNFDIEAKENSRVLLMEVPV